MGLLKQKIFLQFSGVPSGQAVLGLLNPKIDMNLEDIVAVNICQHIPCLTISDANSNQSNITFKIRFCYKISLFNLSGFAFFLARISGLDHPNNVLMLAMLLTICDRQEIT